MAEPRVVQSDFPDQQAPRVLREVASFFDDAQAGVTFSREGDIVTVQVVDRLGQPWKAVWLLWLWLSDTAGGAASVTGSPATTVDGGVQLYVDNYVRVMVTDATGKASISLDDAGSFVFNASTPQRITASTAFVKT